MVYINDEAASEVQQNITSTENGKQLHLTYKHQGKAKRKGM